MKSIKRILVLFILATLIMNSNPIYGQINGQYIDENVAIIDVSTISVKGNKVASILTLKDFTGANKLPVGFSLNNYTYMDNGEFNDKISNDGIYTSKETVSKSKNNNGNNTNSIFYSKNFKHITALANITEGIGCSFERCGCPSTCGQCPACRFFGWDCWRVAKCEVILL